MKADSMGETVPGVRPYGRVTLIGVRLNPQDRYLAPVGAAAAFMAVALGAFGTHGLRDRLSPEMLAIWHTAVEYHFGHALAAIVASLAYGQLGGRFIRVAGWLFIGGAAVFSGSLYALALTGTRSLGAITPLGGLCLLGGWLLFALGAAQNQTREPRSSEPN